jgi:CRISPR/Cas system-associated protein endoribonuclease Cas2
MKIIQGDLILEDDTTFYESIKVKGNILGKDGKRFPLTVYGNITANNIYALNIDTNNITAKNITAMDITAKNITAKNITAMDITAGNITAWDITAKNINARNIKAWDITTWDINALNIDALNITAMDINALNIDTGNITANNIYAGYIVCESRKKKDPNNKTVARIFITNRSKLEPKDWELEA